MPQLIIGIIVLVLIFTLITTYWALILMVGVGTTISYFTIHFITEKIKENKPESTKKTYDSAAVFFMIASFLGVCYFSGVYWYNHFDKHVIDAQIAEQKRIEQEKIESEKIQKNLERVASLSGDEKNFYDSKFQEYKNSGIDENSSIERALANLDRFQKDVERVKNLSGEEKNLYDSKFQEYINSGIEKNSALEKALDDVKELERKKAYEKRQAEEAEKSRLLAEKKAEEERQKQAKIDAARQAKIDAENAEKNNHDFIEISAYDLMNQLEANAARASKNFNGKYVKITNALVTNIDSDGDYINVDYDERISLTSIQCFPKYESTKEQIFNLNKYQYITVYGKIRDVGEIIGYHLELLKIE